MSTPGTATKTTLDIVAEQIDKLRRLFPEVITEGKNLHRRRHPSKVVDALPLDEETVFICQDTAFDDSQKVNLSLQRVLKTI